jgi:hypothetical protein
MQYGFEQFEQVGHIICDTILDYCDPDITKRSMLLAQLRTTCKTRGGSGGGRDGDGNSSEEEDSGGSDSSSSDGAGEAAETYVAAMRTVLFACSTPDLSFSLWDWQCSFSRQHLVGGFFLEWYHR